MAVTASTTRQDSSDLHIHKAIANHEEESRRLTRVFNAHSRAAALPASILALIFLEQAASFYERRLASWYGAKGEYTGEPSHKAIYSWVAVSYVCRSWREAALNCAKLWTTIVLDERVEAHFINILLNRTQDLPLTVVFHAAQEEYHCSGCSAQGGRGSRNYDDAVSILEKILPRTRRLSVFISKGEHAEVWATLKGLADASKLEYLRLEATDFLRYHPEIDSSSGPASVLVPISISSPIPPTLSSLVICGVGFGWSNQLLCSTLRHLNVSVYKPDKGTRLGHLLAALRNMPQLESLDIDETPPASKSDKAGRVSLPHLRNLRIPLENKNSASLLLSLDVPSTTSVLLYAEDKEYTLSRQKQEMPEKTQAAIVAAIKKFLAKDTVYAISYDCKIGYGRCESPTKTTLWSFGESDGRGGDILSWQEVDQQYPRLVCGASPDSPIMKRLFAALPLQSVRAVRIHEDTHRTLQELLECLRGAENLTCLHVEGEVALAVGSALCRWTRPALWDPKPSEVTMRKLPPPPPWYGFGDADDDCWAANTDEQDQGAISSSADVPGRQHGPPLPLLFPRLRALGISRVDFPVTNPDASGSAYTYQPRLWRDLYRVPYGLDVKGLLKSLRLRSGAGASQVVRMDFVKCECIEKERLLPLLEAVPQVTWDGRRLTPQDL